MNNQRGVTLVELIVVVAILSFAVAITVVYSAPWVARESMRSAANDMYSFMQLAKIEAVSRNRECRFVVNPVARTIEIWDSLGTPAVADDERLHLQLLPSAVSYARPDVGAPITLQYLDSETYQSVFTSDGLVSDGTGAVYILGGTKYGRVEVHSAGGIEIQYWDGTAWAVGS